MSDKGRSLQRVRDMLAAEDIRWTLMWFIGIFALLLWDSLFLHNPVFVRLQTAFLNTMVGGMIVAVAALIAGWVSGVGLDYLESHQRRTPYLFLTFVLNLIRSVPQIVGALIGYVMITYLVNAGRIPGTYLHLLWMSLTITVFVFLEITDVIRERIAYYRSLDFVPAMLCCGIKERRIINREILLKNCGAHLIHRLVSVFGVAIFLQCSVDFIISVGLSTDINLSDVPLTLGNLLARMDSKQDILAVSTLFTNPAYLPRLFFQHLQGISTATLIVFTLVCVHKVSNGIVSRFKL